MKQQLSKERDKTLKRTNKDVAEVRRQLEDIVGKNGDLSRTNTDLRHKVTEFELQVKDQKDKISSQKHHIEHLCKIKKKQEETINSLQVRASMLGNIKWCSTIKYLYRVPMLKGFLTVCDSFSCISH